MMRAGESLREASAQTTLLTAKIKTRIGTWNVRTLYEAGKSAQVSREMHRYNLKMLGLCETRWNGTGRTRLTLDAGVGVQNENGELLTEFCTFNDLVIGGTVFQHKQIHKTTWTSPDGRTVNQIDHVTIGRKWRRSLLDVRVKRGADAASDHHLVVADLKVKLKVYRDRADRPSHKYNVHSLKDKTKAEVYQCELRNRFSALAHQP